MKRKSLIQVMVMVMAILTLCFGLQACGSAGGGGSPSGNGGGTPIPTDTAQLTISIPIDNLQMSPLLMKSTNDSVTAPVNYVYDAEEVTQEEVDAVSNAYFQSGTADTGSDGYFQMALVTPGGNQIWLYGTIINRTSYWPQLAVDYTAQVVGGFLQVTFNVPIGTYYHIGYSLGNPATGLQNRVDGITMNGVDTNTYALLGSGQNMWPVKCFIMNRDQAGVTTPAGNPVGCPLTSADLRQIVFRVTGNSANNLYDDTILPYNGVQAGEQVRMQTSLWRDTSILPNMTWNAASQAYEYIIYTVGPLQGFWAHFDRPSREPTAPPGTFEPELGGVFVDIKPLGGGATICSAEMVNWNDIDPAATYWYAAYGNGSACPFGPTIDTRFIGMLTQ